jgi:hypothetical protein
MQRFRNTPEESRTANLVPGHSQVYSTCHKTKTEKGNILIRFQIFVIDKIKTQETGIDMIILDLETNLLPS